MTLVTMTFVNRTQEVWIANSHQDTRYNIIKATGLYNNIIDTFIQQKVMKYIITLTCEAELELRY